jgi:sigma-E factor negative regulatory protein RseC
MSNNITHSGIIDAIEGDCVKVRILQTSACASCKVAGYCNASESKEKIVDVYNVSDVSRFRVGDSVVVSASADVANRALMLGFGLPFVILVSMIVAMSIIFDDEALCALVGLASLIPYYFIVYLYRGRIKQKFAFGIEK